MKKIIIAALAAVSISAAAQSTCESLSEFSGIVMQKRQEGVDIMKMIEVVKGHDDAYKQIILDAFEEPRYSTSAYKARSIEDFKNKITLICLRAGK